MLGTEESSWNGDDRARETLLGNLANATAALAVRHDLANADVDAVISVFGTSLAALDTEDPAPASPCTLPDASARAAMKITPFYPQSAVARREAGTVTVALRLDERGLVRYASVYRTTDGIASDDDVANSALIATVASTYAPARVACRSVPATYLFVANFGNR